MIDDLKIKANNAVDDDHMAVPSLLSDEKTGDPRPVSEDLPVEPHNMDSEVTTSAFGSDLKCPHCGKSTLHAEFPDQYEAWVKCSSCGFFMGMSNNDWHRMENSPNINEKLKKMAIKKK